MKDVLWRTWRSIFQTGSCKVLLMDGNSLKRSDVCSRLRENGELHGKWSNEVRLESFAYQDSNDKDTKVMTMTEWDGRDPKIYDRVLRKIDMTMTLIKLQDVERNLHWLNQRRCQVSDVAGNVMNPTIRNESHPLESDWKKSEQRLGREDDVGKKNRWQNEDGEYDKLISRYNRDEIVTIIGKRDDHKTFSEMIEKRFSIEDQYSGHEDFYSSFIFNIKDERESRNKCKVQSAKCTYRVCSWSRHACARMYHSAYATFSDEKQSTITNYHWFTCIYEHRCGGLKT